MTHVTTCPVTLEKPLVLSQDLDLIVLENILGEIELPIVMFLLGTILTPLTSVLDN